MKNILGEKHKTCQEEFVKAWQNIESLVSFEEAVDLVNRTVENIKSITSGKRVGYAWSGGKDSLALQYVCEKAGIHDCVLGIASHLEYPEYLEYVEQHKPKGLVIYDNNILTLEWLSRHQDMLFPTDSRTASKWFKIIQHKAQDWFFKDRNLDIICLGRRYQDGNYTGRGENKYTTSKGITRLSPIADWKHEQVLAVIHYFMGGTPSNVRMGKRFHSRNRYLGKTKEPYRNKGQIRRHHARLAGGIRHRSIHSGKGIGLY